MSCGPPNDLTDNIQINDKMIDFEIQLLSTSGEIENTFEFIFAALLLLKEDGYIVALLPDDLFDGTKGRKRLSNILPFKVVLREMVGKWSYYPSFDKYLNIKQNSTKDRKKKTPDSLFLIQRLKDSDCMQNKWEYKLIQSSLTAFFKN